MTKNTRNFLQKLFLTWLWLFGRLNPQASAWSPDEAIAWSKVISVSSCPVESTSELPLEFKLSWLISLTGVGDWTSDIFCKEKCLKITKHFLSRIRLFCSQIYNYDVFMRFKGTLVGWSGTHFHEKNCQKIIWLKNSWKCCGQQLKTKKCRTTTFVEMF